MLANSHQYRLLACGSTPCAARHAGSACHRIGMTLGMKRPKSTDPAKAPRDRNRTLRVVVNEYERQQIEEMARTAGMTMSAYLRTAGMNHPIRSTMDYQAVRELCHLHADLGRVGGLLKLWLAERRGAVVPAEKVDAAFRELQSLAKTMLDKIIDLAA